MEVKRNRLVIDLLDESTAERTLPCGETLQTILCRETSERNKSVMPIDYRTNKQVIWYRFKI